MTKIISNCKSQNFITSVLQSEGFVIFWLPSQLHALLAVSLCVVKSQSIAYLLNGSWHYILDFGPWRWCALNMEFVAKRPSRMQGQCFFSKLGKMGGSFQSGSKISQEGSPRPDLTPPKVRRGVFDVYLTLLSTRVLLYYRRLIHSRMGIK